MSFGGLSAQQGGDNLALLKRQERRAAEQRRAMAHGRDGAMAAAMLARTGLGFLGPGRPGAVSGFTSFRTEIDIFPLLARLASEGWTTALPVVVGDGVPLIFRAWAPGDRTVPGRFAIPVPPESAPELAPDVLLVPMLAFDRFGFRLGYGGGFYDRTVEGLRRSRPVIAIGIAYAAQEIAAVPRGRYDQPLDWVLTEAGAFRPQPGQIDRTP